MEHENDWQKILAGVYGPAVLAVLYGSSALAQSEAPRAPTLEEIVVTAQKFEQNLQEVPVAITAVSGDALRTMGVASFSDLQQVKIPSVNFSPFAGRSELLVISMRGIGYADPGQATIDAGVAIMVDDVYNARGFGVGLNAAELERLEVLRGPQGTLFGRNAVGGALRLITKQPTGEFGGNVTLGVGNFGQQSIEAHVNLPEFKGFSLKLDGKKVERDGFTKNPDSPSALDKHDDHGLLDAKSGKATLRWAPTEEFNATYSFEDGKYETTTTYAQTAFTPSICQGGVPCTGASALVAQPRTEAGHALPDDAWMGMYTGPSVTDYRNQRLGLEWEINDGLTLKSITSQTDATLNITDGILHGAYTLTSFGGASIGQIGRRTPPAFGTNGIAAAGLTGPQQIFGFSGVLPYAVVDSRTRSQEFQLLGQTDTVKWVAGAFYFDEEGTDARTTAFTIAYTGFAGGRPINPVATNPFFLAGATGPNDPGDQFTKTKAEAYAAFGQATWTPAGAPDWHFTGGLRYSKDKREFKRTLEFGLPANAEQPEQDVERVDPLVSIAYDLTEDSNLYVRYASAYRAGGASVRVPWSGPTAQLATFEEEVVKTAEVGIKSDLFDRRLRLNAATYYSWLDGPIWSVQIDPANPSLTGTINMPGTQKVNGVELETVFAATERLTLGLNLTWQEYKLSDKVQERVDTLEPGTAYYPANFPKWTGMVTGDYVMPLPLGELALHADWARSSKCIGTSRVQRGAFAVEQWNNVANARMTWQGIEAGPTTLQLSAYVRNLADESTVVFIAPGGAFIASNPRTYGVELTAAF